MTTGTLAGLGWDAEWAALGATAGFGADRVARVVAVDRDLLLLAGAAGVFRGALAGRLRHAARTAEDLPAVGDWVGLDAVDAGAGGGEAAAAPGDGAARADDGELPAAGVGGPGESLARVVAVLPRRTVLRRRAAGEGGDAQLIAANIDVVFVVQSCHYDFNLPRLERYLVMIRDGGAEARVLLTKTDLVAPEVLAAQLGDIARVAPGVPVQALSNVTGEGVAALAATLVPGRTHCIVGSSGVGKSTLVNALLGRARQATGGTSGSGEGRHTTVRRELLVLEGGALLIDNPGMREFGIVAGADDVSAGYADIGALAAQCRYRDCRHGNEPGCAVRAALEAGELSAVHYASFLKLRDEAAFHELDKVGRRHKDRAFGRMVKSAKKDLDRE